MISIIIPVYNEVANLMKLLPSLSQLAKGHEVEIILSTGTCTQDYSGCRQVAPNLRILQGKRRGRAKQMNDGARDSNGEILVFLHADVLPPPGFFEAIQQCLAEGNDAGFFSYRFDSDSALLRINGRFTRKDGLFTGGGDQCLFIRSAVFERLGKFDEAQVIMEDFEFFRRMKKHEVPYTIVKKDLLVSARKYQSNSYLRINLTNLLLVILFKLGAGPQRLKAIHDRLLRMPYQSTTDSMIP
ncbi:transferase 2, rSAM/selenodomain-associated [Robiginitalea myxolifaciens]|uniref:Transferase 2, rSAM/selenodomain-associated n=1 Tax=Robiginitalea myxolifaciens TaxID=400055 RepID=A0A1I6H1N5_9FLAO|nr:TIGR04283 family arsenosugar biosynthesis glycosyltransferase [Robiginitalea myxolifaciens]SFR48338.1 transferase 2, rSAM/selenodomain-associated [Robiginitalea myxolifaciens]